MPVPRIVREIEARIDQSIESLDIWTTPRDTLVRSILDFHRDGIELLHTKFGWALLFERHDEIPSTLAAEHYLHSGTLQATKWAMEFCPPGRPAEAAQQPNVDSVLKIVELGRKYELLVDGLRMAKEGQVQIAVDNDKRILTFYEGGNLTGADRQIVGHQHEVNPWRAFHPLVDDCDLLTSTWTAGDYRGLLVELKKLTDAEETETLVSTLDGVETPVCKLPVIVEVANLEHPGMQAVLNDLTLSAEKVIGDQKWKLVAWNDTPFVKIGDRRFAVSSALKTLAMFAGDDYMLRLAARVDPDQYSTVSERRHERMIELCSSVLKAKGWCVTPHFHTENPHREVDVHATRSGVQLILEMKSTLRPHTPWEVHKRNQDVTAGIDHTAKIVANLPVGVVGFVLTDGYRGDYSSWNSAIRHNVPIGTLEDIEELAEDPFACQTLLRTSKL